MIRLNHILLALIFLVFNQLPAFSVDERVLNWLQNDLSPTGLPRSFAIKPSKKASELVKIGKSDSVTGIIERTIVEEGTSIYDAALWQIVSTLNGEKDNLEKARAPLRIYWEGSFGQFSSIRAGYGGQPFVYDPLDPQAISSDPRAKGRRGFVFRIIDANGHYTMPDPLDGKTGFSKFPNYPIVHWEDWKPIAGENAWVVLAALHLYRKQYFNESTGRYTNNQAIELLLAEEIARAAMRLQSDIGGIRMAPLGTYYHLADVNLTNGIDEIIKTLDERCELVQKGNNALTRTVGQIEYPEFNIWYYEEISTENNLSWYAAFRMLFEITGKNEYRLAMDRIEKYLHEAWDSAGESFYQGMHFSKGSWRPNKEHFATDVQNWSVLVLGPKTLDDWFGEGTAYRIWQKTRETAGNFDDARRLRGLGFTKEENRISVEWTAGAILAVRRLADYYSDAHTDWSSDLSKDVQSMRRGIEIYRVDLSLDEAAYSYSSRREWIPFGWFSHDADVLSLASTAWVALIDADVNPFELKQGTGFILGVQRFKG
nr:hypothetical protein JG1_0260 [uncultured bacterium]